MRLVGRNKKGQKILITVPDWDEPFLVAEAQAAQAANAARITAAQAAAITALGTSGGGGDDGEGSNPGDATPTPSVTPSVTPTPNASATPTPSITPSISVSATPSSTPSTTPSSSVSVTPSVSLTATPSVSVTTTPSISVSKTPSVTPSSTATPSISVSATPSITPSNTATPSVSVSATPGVTPTSSPTVTPSQSVTPSVTPSITATPSVTPSISVSRTPSVTPSVTPSISLSATPTPTPTLTPTPTPSLAAPVNPADPTLQIWLNATNSTNFNPTSPTNETYLGSWQDSGTTSPHDANASGNTGVKPRYRTNIQNGLPAVYFDGANDLFTVNPWTAFQGISGYTYFIVLKTNAVATDQVVTVMKSSSTEIKGLYLANLSSAWNIGAAGGLASAAATVDTNFHVFATVYDGTQTDGNVSLQNAARLQFRIDGSAKTLTFTANVNSLTNATTTYLYYGTDTAGNFDFDGYIAEVIMYNRTLTLSEIQSVESYLKTKWGTP